MQAAHEGETIPVRVSAVAALGALGGPEMVTFLTEISNGPEPRLRMPARQALAQIERKASQAQATKRRQ